MSNLILGMAKSKEVKRLKLAIKAGCKEEMKPREREELINEGSRDKDEKRLEVHGNSEG